MFTQRNQYHVVLEALPNLQQNASMHLDNIYINSATGGAVPLEYIYTSITKCWVH